MAQSNHIGPRSCTKDFDFHNKSNGKSQKAPKQERSTLYKDFFGYDMKKRLNGGRENFTTTVRVIPRALPLQSKSFFKVLFTKKSNSE